MQLLKRTCAPVYNETHSVLWPDKPACLAAFTPLIGIYLEMVGHEFPATKEDQIIADYKHVCRFVLANVPGRLDQVVTTLKAALTAHEEEQSHGSICNICAYCA